MTTKVALVSPAIDAGPGVSGAGGSGTIDEAALAEPAQHVLIAVAVHVGERKGEVVGKTGEGAPEYLALQAVGLIRLAMELPDAAVTVGDEDVDPPIV